MRILAPIIWTLLLSGFLSAEEEPAQYETQHYELGSVEGAKLTAEVKVPISKWGGVTVTVHVTSPDGAVKTYSDSFRIIAGNTTFVRVADFAGFGRKQIFVSGKYNTNTHLVYDYDGKQLRTIYDCAMRGTVQPIKRGKKWILREDWPRREWADGKEMGVGYKLPDDMIRRTMRWDGTQFMPERPRPDKIILR